MNATNSSGDARVVLVTGSSRGIGLATAVRLHGKGHIVYASMRDPRGRNAGAVAKLQSAGLNAARLVELDVRKDDSVRRAIGTVLDREGRLDVVVNNAGIMNVGLAEGFTIEQLADQMDVNYLGPARLFRAAIPAMRSVGTGLFITVSSLAGRVLFPFLGTYNPSKFAVEALAENYRYELSRFGIDSVIVEPGPFATGLIDAAPRPKDRDRLGEYGDFEGAPEQAMRDFKRMMSGSPTHDPQVVAEDIARLIAMPYGARPLRTVSGADYGVGRINEVARDVQRALLEGMSLLYLDPGALGDVRRSDEDVSGSGTKETFA